MLSTKTISHTAGNQKLWALDYSAWLLPGETISSYTLVSSSTTLLLDTMQIFQGKQLRFRVTGGAAGEVATLTVTVTTSRGETKIDTLTVTVNAP